LPDFIKKDSSVIAMQATEEHVYVLYNDKSMEILQAAGVNLSVAKVPKMKDLGAAAGELTSMVLCNGEIWVSDNKGFVHILDGGSLALVKPEAEAVELKTCYGHPSTCMAS